MRSAGLCSRQLTSQKFSAIESQIRQGPEGGKLINLRKIDVRRNEDDQRALRRDGNGTENRNHVAGQIGQLRPRTFSTGKNSPWLRSPQRVNGTLLEGHFTCYGGLRHSLSLSTPPK